MVRSHTLSLLLATFIAAGISPARSEIDGDAAALAEVPTRFGANLHREGEFRLAIDQYRKAQQILHQGKGVDTLLQTRLVEWIAANYMVIGKVSHADEQQRFLYHLWVRTFGKHDPRVLPATIRLADWVQWLGNLEEAETLYRTGLIIIERHGLDTRESDRIVRELDRIKSLRDGWLLASTNVNVKHRLEFSLAEQRVLDDPGALATVRQQHANWLESGGEITASRTLRQASLPGFLQNPLRVVIAGSIDTLEVSSADESMMSPMAAD